LGHDAPLITLAQPAIIQQGAAPSAFTFEGTALKQATVTPNQPGVTVTNVVAAVDGSRVSLSISAASTVPLGTIDFTVTDQLGRSSSGGQLTVVNQQPFNASDAGTLIAWHLDELGNGATSIVDSGPNSINGTADAASKAIAGRFAEGRASAGILAGNDNGVISNSTSGATTSFTVECWVNTAPVTRPYSLVDTFQNTNNLTPWAIYLDQNRSLNASVWVTAVGYVQASLPRITYSIDDSQWHYIAMVVNQSGGRQILLYVDGVLRATTSISGGNLIFPGGTLRAGLDHPSGGGPGPIQFPGVLDEIRVMNFARTAAQIHDSWFGTTTTALNLTSPGAPADHYIATQSSFSGLPWGRTLPIARGALAPDITNQTWSSLNQALTGLAPIRRSFSPASWRAGFGPSLVESLIRSREFTWFEPAMLNRAGPAGIDSQKNLTADTPSAAEMTPRK